MSSRGRPPQTPQLALRVAAFGIVAFGIFAILFLRLWFLQVLEGDQYVQQANDNRARVVRIAAPRGTIVDRNSKDGSGTLVDNKLSTIVTLQADAIPPVDVSTINGWGQKRGAYDAALSDLVDQLMKPVGAKQARRFARETQARTARRRRAATREAEARLRGKRVSSLRVSRNATPELAAKLRSIGALLHTSTRTLYSRVVSSIVQLPYAGVPLKTQHVTPEVRNYILENPEKYPGITVTKEYLRQYPAGQLSAQIFGQISEIGKNQLNDPKYRGLEPGQRIGQSGLEYEYDAFLRGKDGEQRIEVNAANQPTGHIDETPAKPGDRLRLTLDEGLDKTGQFGLQQQIGKRIDDKTNKRAGGAVVALDPRNGEVLAMNSYPSVDLGELNDISATKLRRLTSAKNGSPLFNRAIQGLYAAGSTFKLVTASAGLAAGAITTTSTQGGGNCLTFGTPQKFCNSGNVDHGAQDVTDALTVSSDTFFYQVGWDLFVDANTPLQRWARLYGFAHQSGIDLPGEAVGVVPDAAWRKSRDVAELKCRKQRHVASCGLVAQIGDTYKRGNNVNLAVGQGDLQMTPIQLATAYAGLYDRGATQANLHFPTPHLAMQVETPDGVLLQRFKPKALREVDFPEPFKAAIEKGLRGVTVSGTAAPVFTGWDQSTYPVMGKTGTAERCDKSTGTSCRDQAWFVGMVQDPVKPIVVVATVEDGGFGSDSAAPIVCQVLRKWYQQSARQVPCKATTTGGKVD